NHRIESVIDPYVRALRAVGLADRAGHAGSILARSVADTRDAIQPRRARRDDTPVAPRENPALPYPLSVRPHRTRRVRRRADRAWRRDSARESSVGSPAGTSELQAHRHSRAPAADSGRAVRSAAPLHAHDDAPAKTRHRPAPAGRHAALVR